MTVASGSACFHCGEPIPAGVRIHAHIEAREQPVCCHGCKAVAEFITGAGLDDYWVVNLVDRVLEVYREPVPDPNAPFGWRYARREVLDTSMRATPLAAPDALIRVADLLP